MRKNKLSQEVLADLIGRKRSVVGSYMRGESNPTLEMLIQIADYFGVGLSELVEKDLSKAETKSDVKVNNVNVYPNVNQDVNKQYLNKKLTSNENTTTCPDCESKEALLSHQSELIGMLREKVADKEEIISHLKARLQSAESATQAQQGGESAHPSSKAS